MKALFSFLFATLVCAWVLYQSAHRAGYEAGQESERQVSEQIVAKWGCGARLREDQPYPSDLSYLSDRFFQCGWSCLLRVQRPAIHISPTHDTEENL
jgi:hypothetical protein